MANLPQKQENPVSVSATVDSSLAWKIVSAQNGSGYRKLTALAGLFDAETCICRINMASIPAPHRKWHTRAAQKACAAGAVSFLPL